MKKDRLINFRASSDLHAALSLVAKEERRSLSSTIEMALTNFLKERKAFRGKEKRHYPRKVLPVPAVVTAIHQQEYGQMGIGSIADISLSGVKLLIPADFKDQLLIDSQGAGFEIFFNLPTDNHPIKLACDLKRVVEAEDSIHVGAVFVDADFKSYKTLQTYLI